ncbi:type I addiction module toxin, SymE family [Photorhabdus khanii]|uniref:Type I addiction module toxin, SymE family n=1 Tax=Photorhabdus khanii TaxID=1004150 RepID=A0A7C9GKA3_9GAMM|nr:SymE family type I addiction module toxin [Photorhabdus khanii]MQL49178.1 type I addiction module toxin, SymE family [Photorhabdus khanii]
MNASFSRRAIVSVHLKGNWLQEAGFMTGQPVQVSIEHGLLIIRLVENSRQLKEGRSRPH